MGFPVADSGIWAHYYERVAGLPDRWRGGPHVRGSFRAIYVMGVIRTPLDPRKPFFAGLRIELLLLFAQPPKGQHSVFRRRFGGRPTFAAGCIQDCLVGKETLVIWR